MKRALLFAAAVALGSLAAPAVGQSSPMIVAARAAGQIGERFDGYLGYAAPPSDALRQQVYAVNIRRRALYTRLAAERGASPQEVGITAGCELLTRVGVGEPYLLGDNVWRRREPGQPLPVPGYCRP